MRRLGLMKGLTNKVGKSIEARDFFTFSTYGHADAGHKNRVTEALFHEYR
jgi:hypothetical protein